MQEPETDLALQQRHHAWLPCKAPEAEPTTSIVCHNRASSVKVGGACYERLGR